MSPPPPPLVTVLWPGPLAMPWEPPAQPARVCTAGAPGRAHAASACLRKTGRTSHRTAVSVRVSGQLSRCVRGNPLGLTVLAESGRSSTSRRRGCVFSGQKNSLLLFSTRPTPSLESLPRGCPWSAWAALHWGCRGGDTTGPSRTRLCPAAIWDAQHPPTWTKQLSGPGQPKQVGGTDLTVSELQSTESLTVAGARQPLRPPPS